MAVKLLWYLTSPDGPYPWLESGQWDTDYEHLQQIAITADRLGFTVHSWVQVSMKHLLLLQV